jgi:hypothetical protein
MAGLTLPGWHTVSYFAQHSPILALAIGVGIASSGAGGLLWWRHHLKTDIPK